MKGKRIIIGALIAFSLAGIYESRIIHGIWYGRSLYVHVYEKYGPPSQIRQLRQENQQLRQELEKAKGAK